MDTTILHITHDDKFIDDFIVDFNTNSPISNKYLIYTENGNSNLKHVKSKNVLVAEKGSETFFNYIGNLNQYSAVFIHFLTPFLAKEIILKANPTVNIYLMFWGAEIFGLPEFHLSDLQPVTKKFFLDIKSKKKFKFAFKPRNLKLEIEKYRREANHDKSIRKALKRINYFCHWIKDDYDKIQSKLNLNARYLDFIYGNTESITGTFYNSNTNLDTGGNLLIGNSANETNNHLDIFEKIKLLPLSEKKIYVPLSYSAYSDEYVSKILEIGDQYFGNNFCPITEFINKEEYHVTLSTCEYIIMNHERSQAGGNNIFSLYCGKKLFMNESNNMYQFFKKQGLLLFSIEKEFNTHNDRLWEKLSLKERSHNKKIIQQCFGRDVVQEKYKNIIDKVSD